MIHIQVEMDSLAQIESALGGMKDKSKMVLRNAINNTAKQTVPLLSDEAQKQYYVTKSEVKKSLKIQKAKISTLTAIVTSNGHVNELYGFKVRPKAYRPHNRPPEGHTGNVKRGNPPKIVQLKPEEERDKYKAFVVRYKSGHISIAQRKPGTHMKEHPEKEGLKNLPSTSTPNMLGYEKGVWGVVRPKIYDMLQQNIQAQIYRYLG